MTSFMIQDHLNRTVPASWKDDESTCIFCRISRRETTAHILYEDEKVIAFLGAFFHLLAYYGKLGTENLI